jgi:hypothetical protein
LKRECMWNTEPLAAWKLAVVTDILWRVRILHAFSLIFWLFIQSCFWF